jgi:hypothetical protein
MDFEKVSEELNNKNIIARLKSGSLSSIQYGEVFFGKLVGRTKESKDKIEKGIISLTVLASNYIAYQIPTQDIIEITESLM